MASVWPWRELALLLIFMSPICCRECTNLTGYWYNQLGSEMLLTAASDGELVGEYRTAVERRAGAAGTSHSNVTGTITYKAGAIFGFTVAFRAGKSTAAWTGQCLMCDGREVLLTTWLLRAQVDTCVDKWRSTYISQDYFTRDEQRLGPRKRFGIHTPSRADQNGRRRKRDALLAQFLGQSSQGDKKRYRRDADNHSRTKCTLDGTWYNLIGSQIELTHTPTGVVRGTYRTALEVLAGKPSGKHSEVYGIANYDFQNRTLAFFVVWNAGSSVTGWVGQCHLCQDGDNVTEVLETTWLHRSPVGSCQQNWKSTLHGQNSFFRTPQRPIDETIELAAEFGEDISEKPVNAARTCSPAILSRKLPIIANFIFVTVYIVLNLM